MKSLDIFKIPEKDGISVAKFVHELKKVGFRRDDPRLEEMYEEFQKHLRTEKDLQDPKEELFGMVLGKESVQKVLIPIRQTLSLATPSFSSIAPCLSLIVKALQHELVIPEWKKFCKEIEKLYEECKKVTDGNVATIHSTTGTS